MKFNINLRVAQDFFLCMCHYRKWKSLSTFSALAISRRVHQQLRRVAKRLVRRRQRARNRFLTVHRVGRERKKSISLVGDLAK